MKKQWQLGLNILCWKAILYSNHNSDCGMRKKGWGRQRSGCWIVHHHCRIFVPTIVSPPRDGLNYERLHYLDAFLELQTTNPNHRFIIGWSSANPRVNSLDKWPDERYVPCRVNRAICHGFFCGNGIATATKACWIKEIHPSHPNLIKYLNLIKLLGGPCWQALEELHQKVGTFCFPQLVPLVFGPIMIGNTHVIM